MAFCAVNVGQQLFGATRGVELLQLFTFKCRQDVLAFSVRDVNASPV